MLSSAVIVCSELLVASACLGCYLYRVNQPRSCLVHHHRSYITCLAVIKGRRIGQCREMIVTVPGVRTRLFKQNLISNLFQSGLFQFTGWESHISEPSAPRCRVSLLKIFTLWAVERQQEFVERWDYLASEKRANLPCVVVAAAAGGSILSFFLFPNNILVHTVHTRY